MTEISTFWLIHRKALYFQGQVLYFAEYVAIQHFSFRMLQNFEVISLNKKKKILRSSFFKKKELLFLSHISYKMKI